MDLGYLCQGVPRPHLDRLGGVWQRPRLHEEGRCCTRTTEGQRYATAGGVTSRCE